MLQCKHSIRRGYRKYHFSCHELIQNSFIADLTGIYGKELIQLLICLHTSNGILIININLGSVPAGFTAHPDRVPHKEIIVEDIRYIPLKYTFYLLWCIIAVSKGSDILNGTRKKLLHLCLDLFLCKLLFLHRTAFCGLLRLGVLSL